MGLGTRVTWGCEKIAVPHVLILSLGGILGPTYSIVSLYVMIFIILHFEIDRSADSACTCLIGCGGISLR